LICEIEEETKAAYFITWVSILLRCCSSNWSNQDHYQLHKKAG